MDFFTKLKEEMNQKRWATMTPEQVLWDKFLGLACDLSPENLSCDGELSLAQVKKRRAALMKQWGQLERELGRVVTEAEVFSKTAGV